MEIEISTKTVDLIRKHQKNLEGADAVIYRALCILDKIDDAKPVVKKQKPKEKANPLSHAKITSMTIGTESFGKTSWNHAVVKIISRLGHRKDEFKTMPRARIHDGDDGRKSSKYIVEVDKSVPAMSAPVAKGVIETIGNHFNLDIEVHYQRESGGSGVIRTPKKNAVQIGKVVPINTGRGDS